jgi:prepilin-type N-terminal cleavage/methylation domain-containing protein
MSNKKTTSKSTAPANQDPAPREQSEPARTPCASHPRCGFTLVEILTVVAIVGMMSSLAVPCFQAARRGSRVTAFVQAARVFSQAAELYALDHGVYPPETPAGSVPEPLRPYLKRGAWDAPTPLGGLWDWDQDCDGAGVALTVKGGDLSRAALEEADQRLDDGNLATGCFRLFGSNTVAYLMQAL